MALMSLFSPVFGAPNTVVETILQNMAGYNWTIGMDGKQGYANSAGNKLESWSQHDPCFYFGIRCEEGDVVEIDLQNLGIVGQLEINIGLIKTLRTLRLRNNSFFGTLPPSLANLSSLELFDVSHNDFSGRVPKFLASMPKLSLPTSINVANNFFDGPLDPELQKTFCYSQFSGNFDFDKLNRSEFPSCIAPVYIPPKENSTSLETAAIVGGVVGGSTLILVIFLLILGYLLCFKNRDFHFKQLSQEDICELEAGFNGASVSRLRRYKFEELQKYTDNFSKENRLGEGGFAIVYKGVIPETGEKIAVKRFKEKRIGRKEMLDFLNEIDLISRAVHRNVLKLEGICIEKGERIMVNPYMSNGSVRDHLQNRVLSVSPLSLEVRRSIAIGAAEGLSYLHTDCETRIIHRDIKAANVLLNDRFEAVVADFGLAKEFNDTDSHVTTLVRGTFGHIAPEYILTGKTSEKSDVYSFGVFLLEMVTGKDAMELSGDPEAKDGLKSWFTSGIQEGRLSQMIDVELRLMDIEIVEGEYQTEVLEDMVQVALLCLTEDVNIRPNMSECIRLLQGDGLEKAWTLWQQQESEIGMSTHGWDLPLHGHNNITHSSSSRTGTGTGSETSLMGYNLSGPR